MTETCKAEYSFTMSWTTFYNRNTTSERTIGNELRGHLLETRLKM